MDNIKVIAFDADDTLWDNQTFYDEAETHFTTVLEKYGSAEELSEILFRTESGNMHILGYGAKAVCISMMETALNVTDYKIDGHTMSSIISKVKSLLEIPINILSGVEETLSYIRNSGRYRMVLLTKGDSLDQNGKIERSGLRHYFDSVVIVANKGTREYLDLCASEGIEPSSFAMVGNSFKSDIKPVLETGGWGVHIPFHTTWRNERIEEFDHPKLKKIACFSELKTIF